MSDQAEVHALLSPLAQGWLLLPRVAVRETRGVGGILPLPDTPDWFLGLLEWRDRRVPVVSLEGMAGQLVPPTSRRSRLTLLTSLDGKLAPGGFALIIQGQPQPLLVSSDMLQTRPLQPLETEVALAGVRLSQRDAFIPDLERIEARIAQVPMATTPACGSGGGNPANPE